MPAVWASASAAWTTRPTATANPRKENILRRETFFHCVLSIILTSCLAINHSNLQFLPRLHHAARAIRSAMEGMHAGSHRFRSQPVLHDSPELVGPFEISNADVVSFGCPTDRFGNSDVSLPAPR